MTTLLDGNVLIALLVHEHTHHAAAEGWWVARSDPSFVTSPITQGSLLRYPVRDGVAALDVLRLMAELTARPGHAFWADDLPYEAHLLAGVIGHRQLTDAYLAALARHRGGSLATFDAGLASSHADIAELVPSPAP